MAADWPAIQGQVEVIRSLAATLDPARGDCASRQARFTVLREQLQASADSVRPQMAKVLASFQPGLFAGGDAADLPQDNLDLERWFRNPKGHERRIHGHRHAGVRIVLEGPALIHALDVHQRHPEPLTVADLLPYRQATPPASQLQALARRSLMRLRELTRLQLLTLYGTTITDAGLLPLKELSELKSLHLGRGTAVTEEGLEALLKVRPGLKITK